MAQTLSRRKANPDTDFCGVPLLNRLYAGRGITNAHELNYDLRGLIAPDVMRGLNEAAQLLADAVQQHQQILIIGDFDADGATSSALMVLVLKAMGAQRVDYLVPNRFEYGYGLTPEIVQVSRQFKPALIVTVDNGISSIEGVSFARQLGIKVLITDHHLAGEQLPEANAIVNPNQPGCQFASKALAGVGVAFYLLSALRQHLRRANWFAMAAIRAPRLADYLDLVALGTIADVVPLDKNNRILVNAGIRRIRAGRARPGIIALLKSSGTDHRTATTRDLAFGVGPRLNAAGRLQDMSLGIECLLAGARRAAKLAGELDEINRERKEIELKMKAQAESALNTEVDPGRVGVCLYHPQWHEGIVGIIASRIKDKIHRPVIAFADASEGELKGSARSIQGLHIRDSLDAIATRNPGLLKKFGGHAMAAGLSLDSANLDHFTDEFDLEVKRWLSEEDLDNVLVSDGEIGEELDLDLVKTVIEAAPWGQGFPEPVFDGVFEVVEQRIVGSLHLKMKLLPEKGLKIIEAIAFNHPTLLDNRKLRLAYRLDINRYRGMESVQLIVESTDLNSP